MGVCVCVGGVGGGHSKSLAFPKCRDLCRNLSKFSDTGPSHDESAFTTNFMLR